MSTPARWRPGKRGPRRALTVEAIAEATMRVADDEGIDAVSMQRVAREFGYTTMSLYRYVASKDELMDAAMDLAAGSPPDPVDGEPWRAGITRWAEALWAVYLHHPWMLRVESGAPPSGPNQLAWLEFALRALSTSGLSPAESLSTVMFLLGAVRDLSRLTVAAPAGEGTDEGPAYAETIGTALGTGRYPVLATVLGSPELAGPDIAAEGGLGPDLRFGLARLLDGIEVHIGRSDPAGG